MRFKRWNWNQIGHGHYCLKSDGYVYSHSDSNINYKILSFSFKTGDLLQFKYDRKQNRLTVTNQKDDRFEIIFERKGEIYAACAYLKDIGDSIELIDS